MTLELSYIAATSRLDLLDPDERTLLQVIALGRTEADADALVAARFDITPREAAVRCARVLERLGLRPTAYLRRSTLARLALGPAGPAGPQKISEVRVSAGAGRSSSLRETER